VFFVGRNVAEAFGYPVARLPFHTWERCSLWRFEFACIPHPSGRNHFYNVRDGKEQIWQQFWSEYKRSLPPELSCHLFSAEVSSPDCELQGPLS
jgi:hypothetical protein